MMLRVARIACIKEYSFPMFFHFGLHEVKVQVYFPKIDGTHPMCQALGN